MKTHDEYKKLVNELMHHGTSNGSSLGHHSGLMDEAAEAINELLDAAEHQSNMVRVETPTGALIARPSYGEPDYPGISVGIQRSDEKNSLALALVEYTETEADLGKNAVITRVYGKALEDEYTDRIVHEGIEDYFAMQDAVKENRDALTPAQRERGLDILMDNGLSDGAAEEILAKLGREVFTGSTK